MSSLPRSAVSRLDEQIELFEADLEAMGCGEGRAKVRLACLSSVQSYVPSRLRCHMSERNTRPLADRHKQHVWSWGHILRGCASAVPQSKLP